MEKEGFLLDIDYLTEKDEEGKEKAVIRLWCKSKEGEHFIVLDKEFEPYFYAFPHSYPHAFAHGNVVEKKGLIEQIRIHREGEEIRVKRVECCQKKLLGVTRRVLKIFAGHPRHVPLLREEVRKAGFTVLEADILFAVRYMIDKQLRPFDGVKAEGEEITLGYANTALLASTVLHKRMNGGELPELKTLAFDCEMAMRGGYGMPSPKRDPIVIIAVAYRNGNEVKTKLFVVDAEEYGKGDDGRVITDFLNFVARLQPEIIVGYNSDSFDWQYIKGRAKVHAIRLRVGADGSTVRYEKGGALPGVNIAGRLNVDLFKLAKRDLDSVKVKKLENVAEFLGVMKKSERVNLSPREITDCWIDASPSSVAREQLYEYARADAVSTLGIAEKMLPLQIELSRMVGYPLDVLAKMGRGRQVEAFLTAEAYKKGELVPPKKGDEKTFEGGFVLPPEKGLHEDVIALDFSSMYPTIMISFNISPDTFVESREVEEDLYVAPEVGHAFRKAPDGFFKRIMSDLIRRRKAIKAEMKNYGKDTAEYRLFDIQQQSVKILTNSFYGYTGWSAAKFYKRECAEATTAWGRHLIKRTVNVAEELGFTVIYGDTDSIFAKLSPDAGNGIEEYDRKAETKKNAREVSRRISEELPLELEIQDFFKSIFFTGKKKRYAALTDKGEIVVRGLEVRRGDWCEQAKEVQTKVIELILKEKDPDAAAKFVKNVITDLKEGKIALDKLTIYKTLTRKISGYETKQAHVIAAERASASHIVYEVGSKIPYVILKGAGTTSDRAFPVDLIEESEGNEITAEGRKYQIDSSYYVRHQIIPVAHRVLQLFDYDISSFEDVRQKTLAHWF
jgi:DNA polymerase I